MFTGSTSIPVRVKGLVDAVCDKAGSRDALLSAIQSVLVGKSAHGSATPVYAA
jgi:hypothetical protein